MQNTNTYDKHGRTAKEARRYLDKEITKGLQDISSGIDRLTHERDELRAERDYLREALDRNHVAEATRLGCATSDEKAAHALAVKFEDLRAALHPERLRFDPEDESGWTCAECGEEVTLRAGDDPTPECDHCAHYVLTKVRALMNTPVSREPARYPPPGFGGCATCRYDGRGITGPCRTCTRYTYSKWEAKVPPPLPPESAPQEEIDAAVDANRRPGESFDDALERLVAAKTSGGK